MIRCVRAMSSMGYPEVFHRFCGYLSSREKLSRNFSRDPSLRVVKRQTDELWLASEKILERAASLLRSYL
jgi:hypothetical protein